MPACMFMSAIVVMMSAQCFESPCVAQSPPGVPARGKADPQSGEDAVSVRAFVVGEAKAGGSVRVAVTFDVHPGWHIYWENAGESGAPTDIVLELPAGCTAPMRDEGKVRIDFPVPSVFTHGETTFGYEKRVTLSIPVTLPSVIPEGALPVKVSTRWLVCKERCLLGQNVATVDLSKPVAADSPLATELATALEHLPKVVPASWKVELTEITNDGAVLVIETGGAGPLRFLPFETPGVLLESGYAAESKTGVLRIPLDVSGESSLGRALEAGGLVIVGNGSEAYSFRLPVPAMK